MLAAFSVVFAGASSASGSGATYSQEQTLAVPPASSFQGSAGGDGWAVALSTDKVYNVFHHSGALRIACHDQTTAAACWPSPYQELDSHGSNLETSAHPGLYLDQASGKLYVFAADTYDSSAGVACFDTTTATSCGYQPLTAASQAVAGGWAATSAMMHVGNELYSFNYVYGQAAGGPSGTGAQNRVLCYDLQTNAACAGQPYAVGVGSGNSNAGNFPVPGTAAVGTDLIIPDYTSAYEVGCFDTVTKSDCAGAWPVQTPYYAGAGGAPFPLLDSSGTPQGVCFPNGSEQCLGLDGSAVATPAGLASAIGGTSGWNGPAVQIGPRVYVPNGNTNSVRCYDYSTQTGCANFPRYFSNLSLLYTVNSDPQRPTCLWVNADWGSAQIQSFDAYTGGACGAGSTRVLTSQFIVPQAQCYPTAYQSLAVTNPAPGSYTSGTVQFADAGGNPIPGVSTANLDANGVADLTGLNLNGGNGLPQFVITLTGASTNQLSVKLTWTAPYDPSCVATGTAVVAQPTTVTTSLSSNYDSSTGTAITVAQGSTVTDQATVAGDNAALASGSVRYRWYSDSTCSTLVADSGDLTIATPGSPPSSSQTLNDAGTYYVVASYSRDAGNQASQGACGDESVVVKDLTPPVVTVPSDITAEATGPTGAPVHYVVTATDNVDPNPTVDCSPASDSTFALGTTTVSCTATDASGNTSAPVTFTVTVQDTTPPTLSLHDQTFEATGPDGAVVNYAASATDLVDGAVAPVCTPAAGTTFAIGTTTVDCTATDAAGNQSSGSFTVTVADTTPPDVTAKLVPLKKGGDDESTQTFRVVFSATDAVGVQTLTATLNGITVTNGQVVRLQKAEKGPQKVNNEDGVLKIRATSFTLTVTATDAAGNTGTATVTPTFVKHGKDGESKGSNGKKGGKGH